jgi:hypothetical protein
MPRMSEVERLREENEDLRAENGRLREALRHFAEHGHTLVRAHPIAAWHFQRAADLMPDAAPLPYRVDRLDGRWPEEE